MNFKYTRLRQVIYVWLISMQCISVKAQLNWPSVTNTTKPWTRWWWEGSAVNKADLTWNLEQYQRAGLGGVELTPIYGVEGYEKQFINFLSPQWMQMLEHTLKEAKRLGIGVDLANGTGWPFGGPWVKDADASKSIFYKTYKLKGGEQLNEAIEYKQEAFVRTANNKPAAIEDILKPVYLNQNLQALALDQIQYPGKLPLQTLIAYSNKNESIDLTSKVDANGKLNWTAPEGSWSLYALFQGLHGKMVERAAPGGEGYAVDHFSATAAKNYFKKFDEAFEGYDISYLRSFFNDSYEVDDAKGQANWTEDLLTEFKKRKGYALEDHLPALFGKDSADKNSRVIYDYRSVLDELLLEHFTIAWKKWTEGKNKMVRNQSHGSPGNTLDLYSVVDIPETEGNDILRFKFATSAANVSGKKLVSAEAATWLNEHFLSSWADVKKAVDLFFLGGVNHIFYHGTAYSPKEAPWPGWLFYAAVHFQPSNPQWKDFHALNTYVTRVQSFLQQGKPDNDVLLYYPIADRYSEPGNALLQHFDGMEKNFENTDFEHVSKWMLEKGYGFDFFSDRQLQNFTVSENKIVTGGNSYKTILLPANKLLPVESLKKLRELAKQGAKILFYKKMPESVPGFANLAVQKKEFRKLMDPIYSGFGEPFALAIGDADGNIRKAGGSNYMASLGKGVFYMSDSLKTLLQITVGDEQKLLEKGLSYCKRKNTDGKLYFICNRTDNVFNEWLTLNEKPVSVALFDPMTGKRGLAKWKKNNNGGIEVRLQLQPYESVIIQTYDVKKTGAIFPYLVAAGEPQSIIGEWTIGFLNGGPVIPTKIITDELYSWSDLDTSEYSDFSGTARYSINFNKPSGTSSAYLLDLGKVHETAEVILNGKKIATLIGPTFQCVIPASALWPTNKLEVIVANLMANRISYMDRNNLPWKIFYNTNMPARKKENVKNGLFDASAWKPLPSGLLGPVTITPLK
ncbi:glycosyl hydrolase [Terrimonas pollutisoli]|uniref:glycosyl hydrolase n=1 Tax=Terrimonas pollutisoli TaxID=3034147 RepID=UPI0023EA8006|nr:glycosyl hydrolase [Terrimonas sp. H1YJ31]